jgi:PadR family transcriptional regulator PadR
MFAPSRLWKETMADERLAVIKGTLDVLVLKALAWGAMHGFEVADWLEARSGAALVLDDSALYQALYRLEGKGLIAAEWGVTENNRRARYYRLTKTGKAHLGRETASWLRYAEAVTRILTEPLPAS